MPADMNGYFKRSQGGNSGGGNGGGPKNPFGGGGNKTPDFMKDFGKKAGFIYAIIGIVVLLVVAKPFAIINSGEVGIKVNFGKYEDQPLYPGFHIIVPFVQRVIIVDTKVRITNYNNTEIIRDKSSINQKPPISILDKRGLPVEVELTIQYSLKPQLAPTAIARLGLNWEDKTINPNARDVVRSVIGQYTAEELPSERNSIATQIQEGMKERLEKLGDAPINLQGIQLRGIVLPVKIREQIERVQIAKQEEERARNEVLRTKQEAIKKQEEAKGTAQAKRIEAQGIADKALIEAKAQAEANGLIARSLTAELINLRQVEVQGKFNEALQVNKDAKIFLTPGGSTPNIWVDTKDKQRTSVSN